MVQQQFIISELSNESENSSEQASSIAHHQLEEIDYENDSKKQINIRDEKPEKREEYAVPYSRGFSGNKVSFAIFGTFNNEFVLEESREYRKYLAASQSGFRVLGMSTPDYSTILYTFLSWEGFREDWTELSKMIIHYFKILEETAEMNFYLNYRDYWSIAKIARSIAKQFLDEEFKPIKLDFSMFQQTPDKNEESPKKKEYTMLDQELKEKQKIVRIQIEEHSIWEALEIFSRNKLKSSFVANHKDQNFDPEEKFDYCLEQAKEKCKEWNEEREEDYGELTFNKDQFDEANQRVDFLKNLNTKSKFDL
jgi:hypothetical protein